MIKTTYVALFTAGFSMAGALVCAGLERPAETIVLSFICLGSLAIHVVTEE